MAGEGRSGDPPVRVTGFLAGPYGWTTAGVAENGVVALELVPLESTMNVKFYIHAPVGRLAFLSEHSAGREEFFNEMVARCESPRIKEMVYISRYEPVVSSPPREFRFDVKLSESKGVGANVYLRLRRGEFTFGEVLGVARAFKETLVARGFGARDTTCGITLGDF